MTTAEDNLRRALERENQVKQQTNDPKQIAAAVAARQDAAQALTVEQQKNKKPAASSGSVWDTIMGMAKPQ